MRTRDANGQFQPATQLKPPSKVKRYHPTLSGLARALNIRLDRLYYYRNHHGLTLETIPGKGFDAKELLDWLKEHGFKRGAIAATRRIPKHRVVSLPQGEPQEPKAVQEQLAEHGDDDEETIDVDLSPNKFGPTATIDGETPAIIAFRFKKAQAEVQELKRRDAQLDYDIKIGKYMPIEKIKQRDLARISVVKRGLLQLPSAISPNLVGLTQIEIETMLEKYVNDLLTKFSQM